MARASSITRTTNPSSDRRLWHRGTSPPSASSQPDTQTSGPSRVSNSSSNNSGGRPKALNDGEGSITSDGIAPGVPAASGRAAPLPCPYPKGWGADSPRRVSSSVARSVSAPGRALHRRAASSAAANSPASAAPRDAPAADRGARQHRGRAPLRRDARRDHRHAQARQRAAAGRGGARAYCPDGPPGAGGGRLGQRGGPADGRCLRAGERGTAGWPVCRPCGLAPSAPVWCGRKARRT